MGATCYLSLTCSKKDLKEICEYLEDEYDETISEGEDWVNVAFQQANYGMLEGREAASKDGYVFYGFHSDGIEYSGCRFASDGKSHNEVTCDSDNWLVVRIDEERHVVNESELRQALEFLEFERAVKQMILKEAADSRDKEDA